MKDKVQIFGSPLGMYSLLRGNYMISILKDDGTLDLWKLNEMLAYIANMGTNALRDFYWIDSENALNKISPFWQKPNGMFEFNGNYFKNQRKIAEMCNRYNMRYYLSIFDHCATKQRNGIGRFNPWRNHGDFFYGSDAKELRHRLIDRIIEAFNGLDAGIELCNEPREKSGEFLADTFIYLIRKGMDPKKIILGIDYYLKESNTQYMKDYKEFRERVVEALGDEWELDLKTECITPIHNATPHHIDKVWDGKAKPGGHRQMKYSWDGVRPRPNVNEVYEMALKVLKVKWKAREMGKVHFEVVYGKTYMDPLGSINGISEAYERIYRTYPRNYGMFPKPLPLGDLEPPVTVPLTLEELAKRVIVLEKEVAELKKQ